MPESVPSKPKPRRESIATTREAPQGNDIPEESSVKNSVESESDSEPNERVLVHETLPRKAPPQGAKDVPETRLPPEPAAAPQEGIPPVTNRAGSQVLVRVNPHSGLYHLPGTYWYGATPGGKFMTEADAIAAGYQWSKYDPPAPVRVSRP